MKRTSMYTAVLALSLAMALAGGGLACRTFRERLDALEEQAVLQHQRNVCGLEDAFAAEYDTGSGAGYLSSGADSVCARVGQAYTRGQWLILGSSTAAFALMREGDVAYSALPESVAAADVQQAAAATDGHPAARGDAAAGRGAEHALLLPRGRCHGGGCVRGVRRAEPAFVQLAGRAGGHHAGGAGRGVPL